MSILSRVFNIPLKSEKAEQIGILELSPPAAPETSQNTEVEQTIPLSSAQSDNIEGIKIGQALKPVKSVDALSTKSAKLQSLNSPALTSDLPTPEPDEIDERAVLHIPVNAVRPNPYQPRKIFEKTQLDELASSIKEFGVMQPVSVRQYGDKYELVAGERRLRASKLAGKVTIPAIVVEISERDSAFLALMENLQRENLGFLEEAEGYLNLMQNYGLTQEEVALKIGKSQSSVANKVRLLRLPASVKKEVLSNGLTERHARALLKLPDEEAQLKTVAKIVADGLNVKHTDDYIDRFLLKLAGEDVQKRASSVKMKPYIRDIKIYTNTIKKAVDLIKNSGGDATYETRDMDDFVEVVINIKKR